MKYFIGYLITGEAADWHIKTAKKIVEEFNTWKIYEKILPHITIFYPEGVEDITDIRNYIKKWSKENKTSGKIHITGFDHFDDRVIFAKIDADDSISNLVWKLRDGIRKTAVIKNESFPDWYPHSTLINKLESEKTNKVWKYTKNLEKPNFTLPFNNITIFKYVGDQKWVVDEVFELMPF